MIFHENRLLHFRKLGKMSQILSSAAVVIGALRVKDPAAHERTSNAVCICTQLHFVGGF